MRLFCYIPYFDSDVHHIIVSTDLVTRVISSSFNPKSVSCCEVDGAWA